MDPLVARAYLRGLLYGSGIIATGVILFKYTTPTDEELIARFSPEIRADYEKNKALRQQEQKELMELVKKTTASNDPIWKTGKIGSPFERDTRGMDPKLVNLQEFEKEKGLKYQQEQIEKSEKELQEAKELLKKKSSWW